MVGRPIRRPADPGEEPRVAFNFRIAGGKIVEIEIVGDPTRLGELDLVVLND